MMENIFKNYSENNIKWYSSKIDLEYLKMYSRHIKSDLLHRCDYITAVSYSKDMFKWFCSNLDFTNSNQINLDLSSIDLFNCWDIDSASLSKTILPSWVIIYDFIVHLFSSNWIDFQFKPFQFVIFPNNNTSSIKSKINIYWLAFRAEKICNFSILWFFLYVLLGANLYDGCPNFSNDIDLQNLIDTFSVQHSQLLDFVKSNNCVYEIFKKNLFLNITLLQEFLSFYITRFDYCYDFFLDKWVNCVDFHRLFRGKDLKFTPYTWGSVNIPIEYQDYIQYDKKGHMNTWWLYQNDNRKWISVRCYDKQIKLILDNQCDFYSEYMNSDYKIWRLEFEFHSDFCCPCNKITWYDGRVPLFLELRDFTLSKRALSYLWLTCKDNIFYKKYNIVVDWESRSFMGQYKFIKKLKNILDYIENNKVPVSFYMEKLWFNTWILDRVKQIDFESSEKYRKFQLDNKKTIKDSEIYFHKLKENLQNQYDKHTVNSPLWKDQLSDLLKLLD